MKNKFTIGSQWTTKGGWRAVVVKIDNADCITVWHEKCDNSLTHFSDGKNAFRSDDYNIVSPYTELRKGTVWVNIWVEDDDEGDNIPFALVHYTESEYLEDKEMTTDYKCLASFKHDWTENEEI